MRSRLPGFALLLLLLISIPTFAKTNLELLAAHAVSSNSAESAKAITELRSMGPAGLVALRQTHAAEIDFQIANPLAPETEEWRRLKTALDAVSQQKDSYLGGLFWYTDLNEARAAARASGKPILSLRLLGKLSEEFSCANSRFFRTVLYSNAAVSQKLREDFVLHWQSVRPAPRVTIDFGDGRKLERTLTGNSIHYILNADGYPLEALPGLYGPQAFMRLLDQGEDLFEASATAANQLQVDRMLNLHHRNSVNASNLAWVADTQKIGGTIPKDIVVLRDKNGNPEALSIASLAITKAYSETTILRSMTVGSQLLGGITDEPAWRKIAALHLTDAQLDAQSIGLIKRQTQKVLSSATSDKELKSLIQKLQMNIALDTVRNEYLLHNKLHTWLVIDVRRKDLDAFNNKVYAELFLTPATDPWLGLFSSDTYVALENGGLDK
jgi:hypothetical protein